MRRLEGFGNLARNGERILEGHRAFGDAIGQRRSLDQFEYQRTYTVCFLEAMYAPDVGMVQRGKDLGLALKSHEPVRIARDEIGQDLQCDIAVELCVVSSVNLAHASGAQRPEDFIGAEAETWWERHGHGLYEVTTSRRPML